MFTTSSLVAQTVKNLPAMQETGIRSLGQEDPQETEMATHSSILAWRIAWTEDPGGLWSMRSQRVGYGGATNTFTRYTSSQDPFMTTLFSSGWFWAPFPPHQHFQKATIFCPLLRFTVTGCSVADKSIVRSSPLLTIMVVIKDLRKAEDLRKASSVKTFWNISLKRRCDWLPP